MVLKRPDVPLRVADARPHMVVCVWFLNPAAGEERYLYKDPQGWYVHGPQGRAYLKECNDGSFEGVTYDG